MTKLAAYAQQQANQQGGVKKSGEFSSADTSVWAGLLSAPCDIILIRDEKKTVST